MKTIEVMMCAETQTMAKEMTELMKSISDIHVTFSQQCRTVIFAELCFVECTEQLIANVMKYSEVHPDVMIVFYAKTPEDAAKSFKAHPYDCILQNDYDKQKRLKQAIMKVKKKEKFYVFSKRKTIAVLDCSEIMYFYKTLNDLNICARNQNCIQRKSMKSLQLPDYFYRISASLAVNLDYVASVSDSRLTMKNGTYFHLSRQKSQEFRKVFHEYLSANEFVLCIA